MMVGEHDWFLDMGDVWRSLFGPPQYSFDHKGVHFVTLMSVQEKDFWTERKMTPMQRMQTVAGLDNGTQSRFEVGPAGRDWLKNDLAKVDAKTPLIVFSHSPLYKYYRDWNFWTDDADEVQQLLAHFDTVTVIHGHTHQLLSNRIGNISFHGMLSTAWPWPYAPTGLPKLTVQMNRADPFNEFDGCGDGRVEVGASGAGLVDKIYNLWDRNPVTVKCELPRVERYEGCSARHQARLVLKEDPDEKLRTNLDGGDRRPRRRWRRGRRQQARSRPQQRLRRAAPATHPLPASPNGDLVVGLCDGTTSATVKGKKPGEPLTPAEAKKVSDELMDQWKKKNPAVGASWDRENALAQNGPGVQPPQPSAASTAKGNVPATTQRAQEGHTYGAFTTRDEQIWRASTQAFVDQGNKIFHDAKAMGGTIAVSCDMCHPNGANTHPETYPKYQVQLGRVAMLRDMINWCIENPVRGKAARGRRPEAQGHGGVHLRAAQGRAAGVRQALSAVRIRFLEWSRSRARRRSREATRRASRARLSFSRTTHRSPPSA